VALGGEESRNQRPKSSVVFNEENLHILIVARACGSVKRNGSHL
jgi:hypothetical protein